MITQNSLAMHRWVAQYLKDHHARVYDEALVAYVDSPEAKALLAVEQEPPVRPWVVEITEARYDCVAQSAHLKMHGIGEYTDWRSCTHFPCSVANGGNPVPVPVEQEPRAWECPSCHTPQPWSYRVCVGIDGKHPDSVPREAGLPLYAAPASPLQEEGPTRAD